MFKDRAKLTRINALLFFALFAILFVLIVIKAVQLPITHDEGWSVMAYTKFSFWEIMMYPDAWPNNHILNTILAKISMFFFGDNQVAVRLPNLLFFWVYALAVYRFLKLIVNECEWMFFPLAVLFLLSPYFLDFFALCRGYGISSALTMLSMAHLTKGFVESRDRNIWYGVLSAILASYANFTALVFWAAAMLLAAIYFAVQKITWKTCLVRWALLAVLALGYLALIAVPIIKMQSTNQFVFWTSNGFYTDTIYSVVHLSLSDSSVFTRPDWVAKAIVGVTTISLGWILFTGWRSKFSNEFWKRPVVIASLLLVLTVLVNLFQTWFLGSPNLNGRTALFLIPIFVSMLVAVGMEWSKRSPKAVSVSFAVLILFCGLQHLTTTIRMDSFKEWRFDAKTFEVLELVHQDGGEDATLATSWLYSNSFHFYKKYDPESYKWLKLGGYSSEIDPESWARYYYVQPDEVHLLQENYFVLKDFNGEVLMKRKSQ